VKRRYRLAIGLIALVGIFCLAVPVGADQLEDAYAAAKRGDYATALRLWRPLAEQGNAVAQRNLGIMYATGHGVPKDYVMAVKWYRKAAEQGYAEGQFNLALMYKYGQGVPRDYVQAHMWFNLAAAFCTDKKLRKLVADDRDGLEKLMKPNEIAEAQALATNWKPKWP
jgi:hypothetical protein